MLLVMISCPNQESEDHISAFKCFNHRIVLSNREAKYNKRIYMLKVGNTERGCSLSPFFLCGGRVRQHVGYVDTN